jgi:thiamine-phosphate pyrophosphorylase
MSEHRIIARLHYITNDYPDICHQQLSHKVCEAGAEWVQLRVKNKSEEEWLKIAFETKKICDKFNSKLIINDNVFIAKEIKADGVHLGKHDMKPDEARITLGKNAIIGATANTYDDILKISKYEIDYIGLGPFRFTSTKKLLSPVLGIEGFKAIINQCRQNNINIPIIAIGGITLADVRELLKIGVSGIAVSSAINESQDIETSTKEFIKKLI